MERIGEVLSAVIAAFWSSCPCCRGVERKAHDVNDRYGPLSKNTPMIKGGSSPNGI